MKFSSKICLTRNTNHHIKHCSQMFFEKQKIIVITDFPLYLSITKQIHFYPIWGLDVQHLKKKLFLLCYLFSKHLDTISNVTYWYCAPSQTDLWESFLCVKKIPTKYFLIVWLLDWVYKQSWSHLSSKTEHEHQKR